MRGKFITFEGGEGSGKSTQIKLLNEYLSSKGIKNVMIREPGGVVISEQIRKIILDPENKNMDSLTELLLFVASRRQIVKEVIDPTLEEGTWVLADRFYDSSAVYQGICRNIGLLLTSKLNEVAVGNAVPDLTVWFDIDPIVGLERAGKRGDLNRLDKEDLAFHLNVREGYKDLYDMEARIKRIDAHTDVDSIFQELSELVCRTFNIN